MTTVQFNNSEINKRPILPTAGTYGHGLMFPADVELAEFEWNPAPDSPNYPRFDKDKKGHYAYFRFDVVLDGHKVFVRHHEPIDEQSGGDPMGLLAGCGVEVLDAGDGNQTFDPDQVAPRKVTGIEVGDPRNANGVLYTGRLTGVRVIA